jgi:hypothetical protein
MKSIQDLEYGHAMCPHCRQYFDAATSRFCFWDDRTPDKILIFLCQKCQAVVESADDSQLKVICKRCLDSVYEHVEDSTFSVTSEFTYLWNGEDLVAALEQGHGLPRSVYQDLFTHGGDIYRLFPPVHITVEGCGG